MTADVLPTILGVLLLAAAAGFALLPLTRHAAVQSRPIQAEGVDRFELYRQVVDLEFDRQMGKVTSSDYAQLSAELLARAGDMLRQEQGSLAQIDEQIEHEISAARAALVASRRSGSAERREAPEVAGAAS